MDEAKMNWTWANDLNKVFQLFNESLWKRKTSFLLVLTKITSHERLRSLSKIEKKKNWHRLNAKETKKRTEIELAFQVNWYNQRKKSVVDFFDSIQTKIKNHSNVTWLTFMRQFAHRSYVYLLRQKWNEKMEQNWM